MKPGIDAQEAERQNEIDKLLRRSMAAPVPGLPPDFEQRMMRKVESDLQASRPLKRFRQILLAGYGLVSLLACAIVMRGQGLDWAPIAGVMLASVALVAGAGFVRRASRASMEPSTK